MDSGRELLVVDGNGVCCTELKRALCRHGLEVSVAHDVETALCAARSRGLTDIVVDFSLPDLWPGLEIISQLKAVNHGSRIVVLASYPSIAAAVKAIKHGATHYLPKPVRPEELIAAFGHHERDANASITPKPLSIREVVWEHINRVLAENGGNISAAARALSMHRQTLQRKLKKHAPRTGRRSAMEQALVAERRRPV